MADQDIALRHCANDSAQVDCMAIGIYLIIDSSHIRIVADLSDSTVEYVVNGDPLELAGQTFTRKE